RRHGRDDVRLFEIGSRFDSSSETRAVALAWTGRGTAEHWSGGARMADFFDVKGVVELLCEALAVPVRFEPTRESVLAPGQAASIVADGGVRVGIVGQLMPAVAD